MDEENSKNLSYLVIKRTNSKLECFSRKILGEGWLFLASSNRMHEIKLQKNHEFGQYIIPTKKLKIED